MNRFARPLTVAAAGALLLAGVASLAMEACDCSRMANHGPTAVG